MLTAAQSIADVLSSRAAFGIPAKERCKINRKNQCDPHLICRTIYEYEASLVVFQQPVISESAALNLARYSPLICLQAP